jgi:hypothetical protein
MKRQRRTLGLLSTWLAIALSAIGVQPRLEPPPELAVSPDPLRAGDSHERSLQSGNHPPQVVKGSLAWLARDRRHSSGVELVLRLNAESDGLSRKPFEQATSRRPMPHPASWFQLLWLASPGWEEFDDELGRSRGAAGSEQMTSNSAAKRLGWSGCNAYGHGSDQFGQAVPFLRDNSRPIAPPKNGLGLAALVARASVVLRPWLSQLSRWSTVAALPLIRISLRSGRASPAAVLEPGFGAAKLGSHGQFEL